MSKISKILFLPSLVEISAGGYFCLVWCLVFADGGEMGFLSGMVEKEFFG